VLDVILNDSADASAFPIERDHWLFPIEDRRDPGGNGIARMLRGMSPTGYLQVLDWSIRLARPVKVHLSEPVSPLLDRLKIEPSDWQATLEKLLKSGMKVGCYIGSTEQLNKLATQRDCRFIKNITGGPAELSAPKAGSITMHDCGTKVSRFVFV
jgi:hypothetical protein